MIQEKMLDRTNEHIIDILDGKGPKKLIIIGGMHGNEKSGIDAINHILHRLKKSFNDDVGSIYFLKGNTEALKLNERFLDRDLNRLWLDHYIFDTTENIADLKQLRELHKLISEDICNNSYDNCIFLDLHTFSAQSGIFCIPAENRKSILFAESFGVPFIEKLAETLPGTALSYFGKKGMTSVVFEGGTHHSKEAEENLKAALWHTFAWFGFVDKHLNEVKNSRKQLMETSTDYPHHLELIYRHKLEDYHDFKMNQGYFNFKPIDKHEPLAIQQNVEINSPSSGYILMPLYQKKGSDGFFVVKEKETEYV
jgi:succinylglutamate desuccinylase